LNSLVKYRGYFFFVDKIIEFAAQWISTSDYVEEDWDREEEEEEENPSSLQTSMITMAIPQENTTCSNSMNVERAVTSKISQITLDRQLLSTRGLGSLSRLLLLAINELKQRHELVLTTDKKYVTKHEWKMEKTDAFLIRKIYITPSSFLYEGPYREEKCLVTRQFENEQDCFLRISFRDEGKHSFLSYFNCSFFPQTIRNYEMPI
jgi:hypothetical protein